MKIAGCRLPSVVLAVIACAAPAFAQDPTLNLPLGDPARKDKTAPLVQWAAFEIEK